MDMAANVSASQLEKAMQDLSWQIEQSRLEFHSSSLFPLYRWSGTLLQSPPDSPVLPGPICMAVKLLNSESMATSEAAGLTQLKKYGARSPAVYGVLRAGTAQCLLMEFVEHRPVDRQKATKDLLRSLTGLYSQTCSFFGAASDNFVGSLMQRNTMHSAFADFWWQDRISSVLSVCQKRGLLIDIDSVWLHDRIYEQIAHLHLDQELPRPIHGDLWSGNILLSGEQAYLIDPSSAYSLPEQDFAMLELFGSPLSFQDYRALRPEVDNALLKGRIRFFQLYPLLVHVALFGSSYVRQTKQLLHTL